MNNVIWYEVDINDYDVEEIKIVGKPHKFCDISDTKYIHILDEKDIKHKIIIDSKKGIMYKFKHREYYSKL